MQAIRFSDLMSFSIDHDGLSRGEVRTWNKPAEPAEATYRGWMVTPEQYTLMHSELQRKNITLKTTPEQYSAAHHISGWVELLGDLTFRTALLPAAPTVEQLEAAAAQLQTNEFFVKDYVKSLKTGDGFTPVSRENLPAAVELFIEERGEWLEGGIVLREFAHLPGNRVEMRGWWVEGEWRAVTVHPDFADSDPVQVPESFLDEVSCKLSAAGYRFVTADFTETLNQGWKVIEVGDGQVSGFPAGVDSSVIENVLQ